MIYTAFEALLQGWDEIQHKISDAILEYYNNEEKGVAVLIEDGEVIFNINGFSRDKRYRHRNKSIEGRIYLKR